jgi:AmmeMemoRadiSam system protein A
MQSLSEDEQREILRVARESLVEAVTHGRLMQPFPQDGIFHRRAGVFVTLHKKGKLRGCIGVIQPREGLGESVVRAALGAALEDPRFGKMTPEELEEVQIEVSLLSELERTVPEAIKVGRDGLLIENELQRGLLLPQVAVEHCLTREQFLDETCRKAGLQRGAWKDSAAKIYRFSCEIISEKYQEKSPRIRLGSRAE